MANSSVTLENSPMTLANSPTTMAKVEPKPEKIYFGRLIRDGRGKVKSIYNLKDRCYIGNTTMDPELAFIQTNMACVSSDSLVLDPFCGTGGLLLPAAEFGAYVIGTEINYQIAQGIGKSSRVGAKYLTGDETLRANFLQYNTEHRFLSALIADSSRHLLWRRRQSTGIFDAMVTDPPYGIREKGSKVGNKERKAHWTLPSSAHVQHYPEKAKYGLTSVFLDLLDLAVELLVIGGRLAFWFPVLNDRYSEDTLPCHPALNLMANCEQPLSGKSSRRLLVYEKRREREGEERAFIVRDCYEKTTYRQLIFNGTSSNSNDQTK